MPFKIGDNVVIRKLKRAGKVKSIPKEGHYDIEVGSLVFHCTEADLVLGKVFKFFYRRKIMRQNTSAKKDSFLFGSFQVLEELVHIGEFDIGGNPDKSSFDFLPG